MGLHASGRALQVSVKSNNGVTFPVPRKKNPRRLDSARHDDFARSCGAKPFRRHLHLKLSLAREKLFTDCHDSISHPRDVKLLRRPRVWHFVLV
jgi:hypothetical protein